MMNQTNKIPEMIDPQAMYSTNGQEAWRVLGIMAEFALATERLRGIRPAVSMFGSARIGRDHPYYAKAERIARLLSDAGFSVISGGGPGLMEAVNRGAHGGRSPAIGLNILLPHEQTGNPFQDIGINFRYFFARKMMFVRFASAYVVLPGGFGTIDELTECLTLVQTGKSRKIPIILVGGEFWTRPHRLDARQAGRRRHDLRARPRADAHHRGARERSSRRSSTTTKAAASSRRVPSATRCSICSVRFETAMRRQRRILLEVEAQRECESESRNRHHAQLTQCPLGATCVVAAFARRSATGACSAGAAAAADSNLCPRPSRRRRRSRTIRNSSRRSRSCAATRKRIEEYRVGGQLVWIKVTPQHGRPYYLVADAANGTFVRRDSLDTGLRVPMWLLFSF